MSYNRKWRMREFKSCGEMACIVEALEDGASVEKIILETERDYRVRYWLVTSHPRKKPNRPPSRPYTGERRS